MLAPRPGAGEGPPWGGGLRALRPRAVPRGSGKLASLIEALGRRLLAALKHAGASLMLSGALCCSRVRNTRTSFLDIALASDFQTA